MLDIEIRKTKSGIPVIDSKLLHKRLEVRSYHRDWIRRRIENYGFREGFDYFIDNSKMSDQKGRGGDRRSKTFLITLDMAKELAMLENNEIGKKVRRYFIKAEKQLRHYEAVRMASIEMRKTLTDKIKESGEDERMHGHAYSNYTRLAYSLIGIKYVKQDNFRDTLSADELKRVKLVEDMIKALLEIGKDYAEIKGSLEPIFKGVTK